MRSMFAVAVAATLFGVAVADAQVASTSPQGSDPAAGPSETRQPLTKPNNNGVPMPRNRQVAARLPTIATEADTAAMAMQRRDDRGMNICVGCD